MKSNQDKNFPDDQSQRIQASHPTGTESSQNENSLINQTQQILCTNSKLSPTAPKFASSAPQGFARESSETRLSGAASYFTPGRGVPTITHDPISINSTSPQTSYGSLDGQRLVVERSTLRMDFRKDNRVRHEQTREYHDGPRDISQLSYLPLLAPQSLSESSPSTNTTGADDVTLSSRANEDGRLGETPIGPTENETTISADDFLKAMGVPANPSVPNASCQAEDYHKQPHAQSLTRLLHVYAQARRKIEDLEESERVLKDQIITLTAQIGDFKNVQQQATVSSAELDDLKQNLPAAQDQIQQTKEHAKSHFAQALDQMEGLKAEKESVQRSREWYLNRAKTLQFVENADLRDKIRQLEEQIKDLKFYPERLKSGYQERIESLESSLKTVVEHRGELQKRLAQVSNQRSSGLPKIARDFKVGVILPACVHNCHAVEKSLREEIKNLQENVAFLQQHELDTSRVMFENRELRQENRTLQSDRMKFSIQISRLQRDHAGARKAFRELEKIETSLKEFEQQRIVWATKEENYIKQIADKETTSAKDAEEHQWQLTVLQNQLSEKAWEAENAHVELQKYKSQQVDDALKQGSFRGREIARKGEGSTTPSSSDSFRSSSEESGGPCTLCNSPKPSSGKTQLEPTGREEYM